MSRETLLPFYFGTLGAEERLELEREMLTDPVLLLDYLDLKRELEAAPAVPAEPSPLVWQRLKNHLPQSRRYRFAWIAGLTALAAAAWLFFALPQKSPSASPAQEKGTLFDSGREQFGHSNVL